MLKKILNLKWAGALALACTLSLNAQVDLSNGLIASYPFTGNANDASGNGNNASSYNSSFAATGKDGVFPSALSFDGNNLLPVNTTLGNFGISDFSFSFWFNASTFKTMNRFISKRESNSWDNYFSFEVYNGKLTSELSESDTRFYLLSGNTSISGNTWHHAVFVRTSNVVSIYLNGQMETTTLLGGSQQSISISNNKKFLFGNAYESPGTPIFNEGLLGRLDEVKIYNRALNVCEIKQLYSPFTAQPVMATTPGTSLCKNTVHTFAVTSVAGQTYKWEAGGGGTPSPQTGSSASIIWTNPGSYVITITAFNSCSVPGVPLLYPVTITSFSGAVLTVSGPSTTCVGSTCFYTASAGATTYEWTLVSGATSTVGTDFTGKTVAFTFVTAGVNYVKVRAQNSCGWGDYTTYPVTVNGVITNFSISGLSSVCPNSNSQYTITGVTPSSSADRFYWVVNQGISTNFLNPVSTNVSISFPDNQGGAYLISVIGINACGAGYSAVKTVTITSGLTHPSLTCVGTGCAQLNVNTPPAGTSICWYVNGGTCTFSGLTLINRTKDVQTRVEFTNTSTGCTYNAYYFPGCNDGAARLDESSMTFAQDANPEAFKLYPNPNEGNFIFETDGAKGEATLINIMGQIIDRVELVENQYTYSLNVSAKSTYVLRIRTANANKNIKFVVK